MKLHEVTCQYVDYKQSIGMRFRTEARVLKSFCRMIGDVDIGQVQPDVVHAFLAGSGPVTRFWHRKYEVLSGFYRFATARRCVDRSPLPRTVPKPPPPFVPYIFSQGELQRGCRRIVPASAGEDTIPHLPHSAPAALWR